MQGGLKTVFFLFLAPQELEQERGEQGCAGPPRCRVSCGRSWSPRPPAAVLRVEAPRRVRRRSEGARVLHRLHAPVGEVLVVLELVGVVLQHPELRGRLLLHVLGRAVHRLVGPRVVGPGRPLKATARPCAPPSWPGPSSASGCPGPPRPVQRGELVAQVCRDHKVPVVPVSSHAACLVARPRLGVLVLQRFHGGLPVKTSIAARPYFVFPRVFWLKSMRSACSRSFGPSAADLPSARGRGACTCRPTLAFSASKAMACVTSRSRCLASRYSFRALTLKSSSLSASI